MSRATQPSSRLQWLWILLLALASGPALALGLGQIEVKSRHGQPLLAEIPIVSSDPSELEHLQARLASPETFRRVGLEPPTGLVSHLHFSVALDPRGRPVIRITSDEAVQEAMLTFLLEVDWGQGRLVREYSALVDAPQTAAAPVQAPIQSPEAAPSNVIVRPVVADPEPEQVALESESAPPQQVGEPSPATGEPQVAAAPRPSIPPSTPASAPQRAGEVMVQAGDTLSQIANRMRAGTGLSLDQAMVALLHANPDAFIRGNINVVRQGAVLRMPDVVTGELPGTREASAIVREQVAQWHEQRRPVPQPVEAGAADDPASATGQTGATDARLAIVPPSAGDGQQAGTRSGINAGGEGDMLRQQELGETREALAAREAEVQELKARVAELEQLHQQQQQLIELKDSELASVQQRVASSNAQAAEATTAGSAFPWLWSGLGLILLAALVWWIANRRAAQAQQRTRSFLGPATARVAADEVEAGETSEARNETANALAGAGWSAQADAADEPAQDVSGEPTWHDPASIGALDADSIIPLNPAPAGHGRVELARAYIDLGDTATARVLLHEVASTGDAASRDEAMRLLRELG